MTLVEECLGGVWLHNTPVLQALKNEAKAVAD